MVNQLVSACNGLLHILDLINMYFGSSKTIAKNYFPGIFQQKENFSENLTSSCYGNTFVGVTSKSTNLAKITLLVSMET